MARFKKASDIRVGVIGYGGAFNMGKGHLNEMQKAGMSPVAVCELDTDRLKVAETDFPGIETYSSVASMLKKSDVNLITIITPHNTHAKLGLQCLKAGRHVVCEKPLAITTAECDKMIAEAKKQKLVLSTYHNRHWDGHILTAVEQIKKKKAIGDVYRIQAFMGGYGQPQNWWRSSRSISGGILYDWGVHILEYSLQLIDSEIVEVSGFAQNGYWAGKTKWKKDTIEDEASLTVRFKNGAWLTVTVSQLEHNPQDGFMKISGTDGAYVMNFNDHKIITAKKPFSTTVHAPNAEGEWWQFYQNIANHLTRNETLVITPEWSRRPIHILDLANQSATLGKAMKAKHK